MCTACDKYMCIRADRYMYNEGLTVMSTFVPKVTKCLCNGYYKYMCTKGDKYVHVYRRLYQR